MHRRYCLDDVKAPSWSLTIPEQTLKLMGIVLASARSYNTSKTAFYVSSRVKNGECVLKPKKALLFAGLLVLLCLVIGIWWEVVRVSQC